MLQAIRLSTRRLLELRGKETKDFLQALVTKDIEEIHKTGIVYSFLLDARGRIVSDVFIYKKDEENFLVETDSITTGKLERLLTVYRVRRKVEIRQTTLDVNFSTEQIENSYEDPRVPGFGHRVLGKLPDAETEIDAYLRRRLEWGIPEGEDEIEGQIPLNMNGDIMNGISFDKGCYVGQELIARSHHTGVIRRRVLPFRTPQKIYGQLVDEHGKKQGRILKCVDDFGIALISMDFLGKPLFCLDTKVPVELYKPSWWPKKTDDIKI
uniref:Aminomethyltransferase folate-binding domain-containing protein n=1 Tax=Acrobeloides nanus TaxID=290746 RepID=A0A914BUI8_9BILA